MLVNWRKRHGATNKPSSKPPLWLIAAFVVLSCVILPAKGSAEVPEGYDPHDYQKLVSFLELPNGDGKNGDKISENYENYDPLDPSTWRWVGWTDTLPKKVKWIQWNEMGLVGNLDVSNCEALTDLACFGNQLSSLDASDCSALALVDCGSNQLTSLDVTNCPGLRDLHCGENRLSDLDVSSCTAVEFLSCDHNQLRSLDVASCTALRELTCDGNQFSSLDVSGCIDLTTLSCSDNQLSNLDVTGCIELMVLDCSDNQLGSLDVSSCTELIELHCAYNQLTFADLPPAPTIPGGTYLYSPQADVEIGSGGVIVFGEEIDLSDQAKVGGVDTVFTWYDDAGAVVTPATAGGGRFTFGEESEGKTVYCEMTNEALPDLGLRTTSVTITRVYDQHDYDKLRDFLEQPNGAGKNGNKISASYSPLDPTTWVGVTWSDAPPKKVTAIQWYEKGLVGNLDVSNCTALLHLYCSNNQLGSLDLSDHAASVLLACINNQLSDLDVSNCTSLVWLNCNANRLSSLDVSDCTALVSLGCGCNQLSDLDVSNCTALKWLNCNTNRLSSLDVSDCTALVGLGCGCNRLSDLDVSNCTALEWLECSANQLISLKVTGCSALAMLFCLYNQLTFADLPSALPVAGGTYVYAPQADIAIGSHGAVTAGDKIDLSDQARVGAVDTVFTWYDVHGAEITPTTAEGGKFTFGGEFEGKTIYCSMTNTALPDLTLRTTAVRIDAAHQITFIKPTDANDENDPVNISSGSLVIARIDGDLTAIDGATISVDGGEEQQAAVAGGIVYYLLPAGLESGQHTITLELTTGDGGRIPASVTFHWNSHRRGFGFGRFDFGDVDEQ